MAGKFIHFFSSTIYLVVAFVGLNSCSKSNSPDLEPAHENYYPLFSGNSLEYKVDSIHHDITSDSITYYLKEEISKFSDKEDEQGLFKLNRFFRNNSLEKWRLKDVWIIERKSNSIDLVEENIRIVKIIFPIKKNETWDGNAYNDLEVQNFKITSAHVPHTFDNSTVFDSTTTIMQKERINLVDSIIAFERYATNIGLIEKVDINLDFGSGNKKGYEYVKKLLVSSN